MKQPRQPSITAFRFPVPKHLVGDFLEWALFHDAGGLQGIEPIFEGLSRKQLSENDLPPKVLPAPNGHIPQLTDRSPKPAPPLEEHKIVVKEWAYNLIAEKQPIDRTALGQHAELLKIKNTSLTTALWTLKSIGAVVMNGTIYTLGKTAPTFRATPEKIRARPKKTRARPKKAKSNGVKPPAPVQLTENGKLEGKAPKGDARIVPPAGTHEGHLLHFFRKHPGEQITYDAMKKEFDKKGLRPESAGVAVLALRSKGFVKRTGSSLYEYVA